MRISEPGADGTLGTRLRRKAGTAGRPPRLWPQLPGETRRQLAQQVGQLVRRLLASAADEQEGQRADLDAVDR